MIQEQDLSQGLPTEGWLERSGFFHLFSALRVTLSTSLLIPAFLGIVATCFAGFTLDWVWPNSSRPVVATFGVASTSELEMYLSASGDAGAETRKWCDEMSKSGDTRREGVFSILLHHARRTANGITDSMLSLHLTGVFYSILSGVTAVAWLLSMHTIYGILFAISILLIWGVCGGAVCRAAALRFGRDEPFSAWDALRFSKRRWIGLTSTPLIPIGFFMVLAVVIWLIGVFGAIPWIGDFFVGVGFIIPLAIGFCAAVVAVGGILVFPLLLPGIGADDLDPGDSVSTAVNFLVERPWKYLVFMLTSLGYGAVCILLVKLFVALMLWMTASCLGASMNWGDAATVDAAGAATTTHEKLTAMWHAPRPGDGRPFYGTFDGPKLRGISRFTARCIRAWVYTLWGVVAAFSVAFFYAASTIIYFILRRDVNETDMEEVFVEMTDPTSPASAAAVS